GSLEKGEVGRQPPGQALAGTDGAVPGHRGNDGDRCRHGAPSRSSASPSSRTLVHSSCNTPPCDLENSIDGSIQPSTPHSRRPKPARPQPRPRLSDTAFAIP